VSWAGRWRGAWLLVVAAACSADERPAPASVETATAPVVVAAPVEPAPAPVATAPVAIATAPIDAGVSVDASGLTPGYGEGYPYPPEAYGTDRPSDRRRPRPRRRDPYAADAAPFECDLPGPTFE
jgi:hypothetical protein